MSKVAAMVINDRDDEAAVAPVVVVMVEHLNYTSDHQTDDHQMGDQQRWQWW